MTSTSLRAARGTVGPLLGLALLLAALLWVLVGLGAGPGGRAEAYSYGNPNREELADQYEAFAAALQTAPPDFAAANRILRAIEEEATLHFGEAPVAAVRSRLQARDAGGAIQAFRQLLVFNIARRLENARENIEQFSQVKILLAKAFATYEALSPAVKAADPGLDKRLRGQFDQLLRAIGNPGLFGVGRRAPDPKAFEAQERAILTALQKQFGIEELNVGHFVRPAR